MDRYTQEQRWDHARDYRKHEPRPGERGFEPPAPSEPPARLITPIATALEVAVLVKGVKDVREGAKLVEQYARTTAVAVPMDRRFAVAKMVGYCEGIASSGSLGNEEFRLREIIAEVLAAFDMPSKAERDGVPA